MCHTGPGQRSKYVVEKWESKISSGPCTVERGGSKDAKAVKN